MSELKIDNPAQRLLDLLEQGNKYQRTDNCRKVWQKILQVEDMEEHHLLTRLACAMALPGRIIQVREDNWLCRINVVSDTMLIFYDVSWPCH